MITFGPVPSRRPGRSLGINDIAYVETAYDGRTYFLRKLPRLGRRV